MPDEQQRKPMVPSNCLIVQHICRAIVLRHDGVDAPIIIYIPPSHSPPHPGLVDDVPRLRGDIYKALSGVMRQKHRLFIPKLREIQLKCVQVMPLSDEQILSPIVVIIEKSNAPTRVQ